MVSCSDEPSKTNIAKETGFSSYKLFEEPNAKEIKELKFYFLAAYWGGMKNACLLSIRSDGNNNTYGYYKIVSRDFMPPISNMIKEDTTSFMYSSIYFRLKPSDIDTLRSFIKKYSVHGLKDTVIANDIDAKTRELIVYDNQRFLDVFRTGSEASLERNYKEFFETIMQKYTPSEPVPFFRR